MDHRDLHLALQAQQLFLMNISDSRVWSPLLNFTFILYYIAGKTGPKIIKYGSWNPVSKAFKVKFLGLVPTHEVSRFNMISVKG